MSQDDRRTTDGPASDHAADPTAEHAWDENWDEFQALSENMMRVAAKSQQLVNAFVMRQQQGGGAQPTVDPYNIGGAFLDLTTRMMANPAVLVENQMQLWQDYMRLLQTNALRFLGEDAEPVISPERGDRRFRSDAWTENQLFDFIKQSYLLAARCIQKSVAEVDGLDREDRRKVDFYTKQFVEALSPSNFLLTNPDVLHTTMSEKGENLVRGLEHMLADLERGGGEFNIKMTDADAFEVGRNIAVSPGKVVYENAYFQLIQYAPSTEQVHERPLLIFPPWINKFYILDLTEKKSFVRWAVAQGHTVFMVSWVNPDSSFADTTMADYMRHGQLEALRVVEAITGVRGVNVIGYCVAGTLFSAALAYLTAKGEADRVNSATFLTTQVDFADAGELSVFIDEEQLEILQEKMEAKGYLDSKAMATTFNMLRSSDLIWSFVVNNYMLGKEPFPFDLLYWNSDSTNLPKAMHLFYLDKMYQKNLLVEPGGITLDGVAIDLRTVKTPAYVQAGKEDHISPANSVYKITQVFSGPVRFMLAGSGHIAGVVNPPEAEKYQYWTNTRKPPQTLDKWFEKAEEHPGSWWPDWQRWIARKAGPKVPARTPGDHPDFPAIEDAPGRYVKVKGDG
ncbi:class I poly(R)-hydroxyalkanoic acid synthase [Rhodothalassium salexigens]|uniref:class I poly(R)-hydroxyalkanoic acid synthase n=1 Tax=Rhodothalassium salexigens TaxID=1086 RepID=UPI0019144807|nr:class I poly(R)-hydroxyalkanoic acid synthase [Rhodothalassium salexigens]